MAELDDIIKERIEALKLDRDRASTALERAKVGARQHIEIGPVLIEQFGCMMREKLSNGDNAFRKTYISAIVDRVEVDDRQVRIIGRKEVLEQAVRATGAAGPGVRSFVPKWRAAPFTRRKVPLMVAAFLLAVIVGACSASRHQG